jgi:HD-GYP domain-containing protein (c-di-GMP phosphodiesterase class II)
MKVKTEYLIPGCILNEDVYKSTNIPLLKKKTILTDKLISILHIFLIRTVNVENKLVDGSFYKPEEVIEEDVLIPEEPAIKEESRFISVFLQAVQKYKKLFLNWQSGSKVDLNVIRKEFIPLLRLSPSKEEMLDLHHYGSKNDYHYYHAVAVAVLSVSLGRKYNLSEGELIQLGLSALLADCGMARLPYNVYGQQGPLTSEEYNEVRKHPLLGYKMLEGIPGLTKAALLGVLQHQEREDGSGYPLKTKGKKIHLYAKIIMVCDMYHAMTSERCYRAKQSPYRVLESISKDNFGKIDHYCLQQFIQLISNLSIGVKVRLNNGWIGTIIYIDESVPMRPLLQVENNEMINLLNYSDLYIEQQLGEEESNLSPKV